MDLANSITSIVALGGLFLSIASLVAMKRMRRAEAEFKESERRNLEDEITERVLARANVEIDRLSKRIEVLENELKDVTKGAWANHDKLKENGIVPPYTPPKKYPTGPLAVTKAAL